MVCRTRILKLSDFFSQQSVPGGTALPSFCQPDLPEENLAVKQRIKLFICPCFLAIAFVPLKPASATIWECGERSNLPPEGKNYCAAGDFRQSELNMKKILDLLFEKHGGASGDTSALSEAQSVFESTRDSQCESEHKGSEGEPWHPMIVAQCKTRLTNIRIDELKRMQTQDL